MIILKVLFLPHSIRIEISLQIKIHKVIKRNISKDWWHNKVSSLYNWRSKTKHTKLETFIFQVELKMLQVIFLKSSVNHKQKPQLSCYKY